MRKKNTSGRWRDPSIRGRRLNLESLETRLVLAGDVVISEFQAASDTAITDQDSDASDWLEIHNQGIEAVSLDGWYLSDDRRELDRWQFPAVTLEPNAYLVVFASGKDRSLNGQELHTNFALSSDGEFLGLVEPDGQTLSHSYEPTFPRQISGYSFGLTADGSTRLFSTPTPGEANLLEGSFQGLAPDPSFSLQSGFYEEALTLELSSSATNSTIRYTLDSSMPNESSPIYSAPLEILSTTIVRAATFETGFLTVSDAVRSYIFLSDVLEQDGAGLPETWGTFRHDFPLGTYDAGDAVPANYEVDPEIVNDPRYRDSIKGDLQSIPSLSLVFEPDDFWSEANGIYSNTLSSGVDWERAVTAELIDSDGAIEFQVDAGARIHGAFSRRPSASAKHSIRLLFKSEYGPTKLAYPWFGEHTVDEFDTVVLRASYNYSWSRGERNNTQHAADGTFLQDRWASETQNEIGGLAPNGNWVHLYINGLYWGLYNPNERPDASFLAAHQGGVAEDYDVIKIGEVSDGDDLAWNELLSIVRQNPIDYEAVHGALDVTGFIDYMMINHLAGNEDWPHNNWYASRERTTDSKWQFHSWDAELLFRDVNQNRVAESGRNGNDGPGEIYNRLRRVDAFRIEFGDRIQKHFFADGVLTPQANIDRLERIAVPIDRAIVGESARWGDALFNNIDPALTRDDWLSRLEQLTTEYFPARTDVVLGQYIDVGLYPGIAAPTFSQHGGVVGPEFSLSMAGPTAIYYSTDGSDPRTDAGGISPGSAEYTQSIELAGNTIVQARSFDGESWSALVTATFSRDLVLPLRISEIMYNPVADTGSVYEANDYEFIEFVNSGEFAINVVGAKLVAGVDFSFPAVELASGERAVVVNNIAAFQSRYGVEPRVLGQFESGQLSNGGETLSLLDARGFEIHAVAYNDDAPWPVRADGAGASLVVKDPLRETELYDSPENWRASSRIHGSPGSEGIAPVGVVINEVLPRTTGGEATDSIELFNPTSNAVDLGGWFLSDSQKSLGKFAIPAGTILGPSEYIVFDESDFNPNPLSPSPADFALDGTNGDDVWLTTQDDNGVVFVDEVTFGTSELGQSWGRIPNGVGEFLPLHRSRIGFGNAVPRVGPLVITEIHYAPTTPTETLLRIAPGVEANDLEFIEVYNPTSTAVEMDGWQIRGGVEFDFARSELAANGLLLVVSFDPNASPVLASAFRAHYGISEQVELTGGWEGRLSNDGESIRLLRPIDSQELGFVTEDVVYYDDAEPWPDGNVNGRSLNRATPTSIGTNGAFWLARLATPGAIDFSSVEPGDVSGDGTVDANDIDFLFAAVRTSNDVIYFDLNADQNISDGDVTHIIEDLLKTRTGDADLDGDVDFADFLALSASFGQQVLGWKDGDFDGDGSVSFADFLLLSSEFGFQR